MSTQHTPGPWSIGTGSSTAKDHAVCAGPRIVAEVLGSGYPIGRGWSQTSAADARLIAAAPDMLEALQRAVKQLAQHRTKKLNFDLELSIATANKAIAKAKERDHA